MNMKREIAPAGHGIAANGGQNIKATTPHFFTGIQGVGRGDSNHFGPRRFAGRAFTTSAVGFDSRVVHPHYSMIVKGSF
jgi:hypothetical protein